MLFDKYNNRWIMSAGANAASPTAYILIGVSQTSDPTGAWNLYKVSVDAAGAGWADYPTLGFNGDWIVLQTNVFTVSTGRVRWILHLRIRQSRLVRGRRRQLHGLPRFDRIHRLPGSDPRQHARNRVPGEKLGWPERRASHQHDHGISWFGSADDRRRFPHAAKGWQDSAPLTNFAPQLGSTARIDTDDDRIGNCVYRNGSLWAAQTVFFPSTGAATRASAQWWQINTASGGVGVVQQLGRRDDPSGAFDYAYPTLDVNANDDMMLGYSRFGATQYASANYSFRLHNDPPNTLEADTVFKAGEAPYFKDFGTGDNRWGDYSNVAVDPVNDIDLWTIQEYAGTGNTWGTWWGTIALSEPVATPTATATRTPTATPTPTRTPKPRRTPKPKRSPKPKRTPTATPTSFGAPNST